MSEQEEEVEVIPRQLLSPLNYLEFDNYSCCPPLSPQYSSSGSDLSLWDFSADCINSHSTGDTQLYLDLFSLQFSLGGMVINNKVTDLLATCKIIGDTLSWEWFAIDSTGTLLALLFRNSQKLSYAPEIGDRFYRDYLGDLLTLLTSKPLVTIAGRYRFTIEFDSTGTSSHVFRDKLLEGISGGRGVDVVDNTCKALNKVGDVSHNSNLEEMWKPLVKHYFRSCRITFVNEPEEEKYLEILDCCADDKLASRIESIPTYQTNNATLGPEALQNGEESGKTYSVEQQRVLKFDSGYDRRKISDTRGKNLDPILKKARHRITLEDLEQHFGLPLNDAVERLGISRSTLKRLCREHDIPRWPSHKKKRINVEQNIEHVSRSVQEAERALATLGPEALGNGEESGKTYSVEQQRVLKFDSGYDRRKINDTRGKNPDPILKKARDRITLEDLQQHFGLPLNDAAEQLGVSRSTLKRLCREHDIPLWPSHKKKRINVEQNIEHVSRSVQESERALVSQQREASVEAPHPVPEAPQFVQHETPGRGNTIENIDTVRNLHAPRAKERVLEWSKIIPPDSYPPQNKVVESFPSTNPSMQVAAVQETRKITIKARYMDVIIKFPLSSSSGIAELQKEVIKRLKLRKGKFTIKYLDIDQDWILIACNEDLQACLSAGTGAIQMLIQSK